MRWRTWTDELVHQAVAQAHEAPTFERLARSLNVTAYVLRNAVRIVLGMTCYEFGCAFMPNYDPRYVSTLLQTGASRRHGHRVTQVEFAKLLAAQNGRCAICGCEVDISGHTDHDHETGRIRGILCLNCNLSLGHYERWAVKHEARILEYLANTDDARLKAV